MSKFRDFRPSYLRNDYRSPEIHFQVVPLRGVYVSIFNVRINAKSFPWIVRSVQETYLSKFSATSDVRYCVLKPQCWCGLTSDILNKSRLSWKLKMSSYRRMQELNSVCVSK